MKKLTMIAAVLMLLLVGCSSPNGNKPKSDKEISKEIEERYLRNQPIPKHDWSQYRQTLLEIEEAQITTIATTTFFFNQGTDAPIDSCPSIGFPLPTTAQLSNPQRTVSGPHQSGLTLPSMEPTGVYTGDSSGTYVLCTDAEGRPYANYWEGFVKTVSGVAVWDDAAGRVKLTGAPSFEFTEGKGK